MVMCGSLSLITYLNKTPQSGRNRQKNPPPRTPQEEAVVQLLSGYAQQVAIDYRLNLPSLLQRNDILAVVRGNVPERPVFSGWRNLLIAQPILAILKGEQSLSVSNHHIVLTQKGSE